MISPFGSPETTYLGTAFVVLGYLLAVHGWTFLVAGYDESSEIPTAVVTDTVGRFALLVGVATIGFGAFARRQSHSFGQQGVLFGAVVLLATVGLTYRLNTYEPSETTPDESAVELSTSPVEPETEVELSAQQSVEPAVSRSVTKSTGNPIDGSAGTPVQPSPSSSDTATVETPTEQSPEEPARNSVETIPEASD